MIDKSDDQIIQNHGIITRLIKVKTGRIKLHPESLPN